MPSALAVYRRKWLAAGIVFPVAAAVFWNLWSSSFFLIYQRIGQQAVYSCVVCFFVIMSACGGWVKTEAAWACCFCLLVFLSFFFFLLHFWWLFTIYNRVEHEYIYSRTCRNVPLLEFSIRASVSSNSHSIATWKSDVEFRLVSNIDPWLGCLKHIRKKKQISK